MNKIQVGVIAEHGNAAETMGFLARLTQRGHTIESLEDIKALLEKPASSTFIDAMMKMELHGTIKRFTPITIAIVGASRRFLAQARTNQVGFNYVSASLQYSDYSDNAQFVVPYELTEYDEHHKHDISNGHEASLVNTYLKTCKESMDAYRNIALCTNNDTAGYAAPQGLRNILIMQGNIESWMHFVALRACNRNTTETQYVACRIWEELLKTYRGVDIFKYAGPACLYGTCTEGKMSCKKPFKVIDFSESSKSIPRTIIETKWPLLAK